MITNTQPLVDAIKAGDLTAAQTAYAKARPYYERIEPVAESFTSGKDNLDATSMPAPTTYRRPSGPATTASRRACSRTSRSTGLAPYATGLMTNLKKLQGLTEDLTYQPAELANGAVGLLDEASKTKITGEEERYSHIDLVDLQGNVEGSEQAFAALKPGLDKIDSTLSSHDRDPVRRRRHLAQQVPRRVAARRLRAVHHADSG